MKVDSTSVKDINSSTNIKNIIREQTKTKIAISENYQVFLSVIYFLIGCSFLFYLFSFVFSIYVRYIN